MRINFRGLLVILIINANQATLQFPPEFKFGIASSSYQIEGGWNEDGKGPSMWDYITHNRSDIVENQTNGDIACDSYHKWEEDIKMIKYLGVDVYRFSISWPRLFPEGYITKINPAGVEYYNKIIDKLLENNIEPFITLYHWDMPQKFIFLGGWKNPVLIELFAAYARKVFEFYGDRVKNWITINEPRLICQEFKGFVPDANPDIPIGTVEYQCSHNILRAHAEAYHIYDKEFRPKQKGKIGITNDVRWYEPNDPTNPEDVQMAEQNMQFDFGLYTHPIYYSDYPKLVIDRVAQRSKEEGLPHSRLPKFTYEEKMKLKGSADFLGLNHYMIFGIQAESPFGTDTLFNYDVGGTKSFHPNWKETGFEHFKVYPKALRKALNWIKQAYNNPNLLITENGYADSSEILEDNDRIQYFKDYLTSALLAVVEDGVNLKGYTAWTLMDDFEWFWGYSTKFGLYHVNFTSPERTRTPKKSATYYKNVIKSRTPVPTGY